MACLSNTALFSSNRLISWTGWRWGPRRSRTSGPVERKLPDLRTLLRRRRRRKKAFSMHHDETVDSRGNALFYLFQPWLPPSKGWTCSIWSSCYISISCKPSMTTYICDFIPLQACEPWQQASAWCAPCLKGAGVDHVTVSPQTLFLPFFFFFFHNNNLNMRKSSRQHRSYRKHLFSGYYMVGSPYTGWCFTNLSLPTVKLYQDSESNFNSRNPNQRQTERKKRRKRKRQRKQKENKGRRKRGLFHGHRTAIYGPSCSATLPEV